jgi:hypothetical protein
MAMITRPNYTMQNAELHALECVASVGSRLVIGAAILFVLIRAAML